MFFAGSEDEFAEENDNTSLQVEDLPTNASPPLKQTSKMRVWRPHEWKQNRAKKSRNSGEAYRDQKNNLHTAKRVRELGNHHCRYGRTINIPH